MLAILLASILASAEPSGTLLEYVETTPSSSRRLALFEDRMLVLHEKGPGEKDEFLQKVISEEEMLVYRTYLKQIEWNRIVQQTTSVETEEFETRFELVVHLEGKDHVLRGSGMDTFSHPFGNVKAVLDDLEQVLRTQTTKPLPFEQRIPKPGDRVVDLYNRIFRVREFRKIDSVYVLECESSPLLYEFTLEQMSAMFKGYADPDG